MKNPWEMDWSTGVTTEDKKPWEEDWSGGGASSSSVPESEPKKPALGERIGQDVQESLHTMEANQARWENPNVTPLGRLAKATYPIQQGGELFGMLGKIATEPFAPVFNKISQIWSGGVGEGNPLATAYSQAKVAADYEPPTYNPETLVRLGGAVKTFKEEHPDVWATGKGLINLGAVLPAGRIGKEIATKAAPEIVKGVRVAIGAPIKAVGTTSNELLVRVSSEVSGISKEALNMAASGKVDRATLKEFWGKANEIGKKLLTMLDKPKDYLPEAPMLNDVLKEMPDIDMRNVINTLEKSKVENPVPPGAKAANEKIDAVVENIKEIFGEGATEYKIPASKFRDIREQLDESIPYDDPAKKRFDEALYKARTAMKKDLINSAVESGNPEYVTAMNILSDKLQKIERARAVFSKGTTHGEFNAESVMRNLFNKGKTERLNAIKAIEDVFGKDFVNQAQLAQFADQIGEGGIASWLPKHPTGKSLWAKGLLFPVGSPKVITRVTLPITKGIEKLGSLIMGESEATLGKVTKKRPTYERYHKP